MKIKDAKQLKQGDTFKWEIYVNDIMDNDMYLNKGKYKTVNVVVLNTYPHFVSVEVLEPPYRIFTIQNSELYQKGIYSCTDAVNEFAR